MMTSGQLVSLRREVSLRPSGSSSSLLRPDQQENSGTDRFETLPSSNSMLDLWKMVYRVYIHPFIVDIDLISPEDGGGGWNFLTFVSDLKKSSSYFLRDRHSMR
jgi:hypothetical protein